MRLTLDLDDMDKREMMEIHAIITDCHPDAPVEIWKSASGKGWHVIQWNVPEKHVEAMRWLFDDPKRVAFDRRFPDKPQQVLFTMKNGRRAKRIL